MPDPSDPWDTEDHPERRDEWEPELPESREKREDKDLPDSPDLLEPSLLEASCPIPRWFADRLEIWDRRERRVVSGPLECPVCRVLMEPPECLD